MLSSPKHLFRTVDSIILILSVARKRCFSKPSMVVFLGIVGHPAHAQQPAPRVYTYVEQMPQLLGRGTKQIAQAIMERLRISGKVEPSCYQVMVYFEVSPTGVIQHARITAPSQSAAVDSALLRAVHSLPTLRPGYQQDKPVTVSLTMPMRIATQ